MTMSHHRLPREIFAGLASGGGGDEAVRELAAAEFSKHVILLRGVLSAAHGSAQYRPARAGYNLLVAAWRDGVPRTEPNLHLMTQQIRSAVDRSRNRAADLPRQPPHPGDRARSWPHSG